MEAMTRIEIYTKDYCPYCRFATRLLESKGQTWEEVNVSRQPERMQEMLDRSGGRMTAPEIFIDGQLIGGWDELSALEQAGELDPLLGLA